MDRVRLFQVFCHVKVTRLDWRKGLIEGMSVGDNEAESDVWGI